MNLTATMVDLLHEVRQIEPQRKSRKLDVPANELGVALIELYRKSHNLRTRELITMFMSEAGFVWLQKLVTRDISPVSEKNPSAALAEYLVLEAANDPTSESPKRALH